MNNAPRYLITTADERTWTFDRPAVFLGEWCRVYDRKHIWQGMDAVVAPPYGLGKEKKDADHAEARALEEKLFPMLYDVLNYHHGTQHDSRYWRIVLGHWLRRYIDVILNRARTLEQCLRLFKLSGTATFSGDHYSLAPLDSYAAIWAFDDDRWNNQLYVKILGLLGGCPIDENLVDVSEGYRWSPKPAPVSFRRRVLRWGFSNVTNILGRCSRKNDAFIINSYLPRNVLIKFQLALGQCPQFWVASTYSVESKPDIALRKHLARQLSVSPSEGLFWIMSKLIFDLIPISFLEAYHDLDSQADQLKWPATPKFIFTSNNFDADDLFKLWAAKKIAKGCCYITGQHGNNYGTYRYMNPSIEEATSDKFITWGWTDGLRQHTPAFVLKTAAKPSWYKPKGGLLLIEDYYYNRLDTWDRANEFEQYWKSQASFVASLVDHIREQLTIRLHAVHRQLNGGEVARWHDFDSSLNIDFGDQSIRNLVAQSRLIVHGYDSTGILETLSQNIPTLAFWPNGFDHLRDSAKPHYQLLVDAGIVHLTPESVAAKVNEVWDDVGNWWARDAVQQARRLFCNRYGRDSQNPVRELTRILSSSFSS